jgi:hypothetical protein
MSVQENISGRKPKLAIFGTGGLGCEMVSLLTKRPNLDLVAVVDKSGYKFNSDGLELEKTANTLKKFKKVSSLEDSIECNDAIMSFLRFHAQDIDCIFYALPNLPNEFIPNLTAEICAESNFKGVIVDALKRTSAVKLLSGLDEQLKKQGILYITGCGATPGLLTAAVSLASQSFVEIENVEITFGVGIGNWQAYRATIREDIGHLEGFDIEKARNMTDEEVDAELARRNGLLELKNMEHADDIILELAGICPADRVTVGGLVDTRNAKKPISTNVKVTGITYQGLRSTNTFILGDETTMAANVNGTALGYLNAGVNLLQNFGIFGFKTSVEIMPSFSGVKVKTGSLANCG